MFTAALFIVVEIQIQSKCPLMGEWIKLCIYNTILSSHKKERILPFVTTWMDLEDIMLRGMSQRPIQYDFTYMWNLNKTTSLSRYREQIGGYYRQEVEGTVAEMGEGIKRLRKKKEGCLAGSFGRACNP